MAYATVHQLLTRFDRRDLGDLASDDDNRVGPEDLADHPRLQAALDDASGDIDAAMVVAGRYDVADLAALTGSTLNHLIRMTCDIAAAYLMTARLGDDPEKIAKRLEVAEAHLEKLRQGTNVFNLADNVDAGLPAVDGPTSLAIENLYLVRDRTLHTFPRRYFPDNR